MFFWSNVPKKNVVLTSEALKRGPSADLEWWASPFDCSPVWSIKIPKIIVQQSNDCQKVVREWSSAVSFLTRSTLGEVKMIEQGFSLSLSLSHHQPDHVLPNTPHHQQNQCNCSPLSHSATGWIYYEMTLMTCGTLPEREVSKEQQGLKSFFFGHKRVIVYIFIALFLIRLQIVIHR